MGSSKIPEGAAHPLKNFPGWGGGGGWGAVAPTVALALRGLSALEVGSVQT